MTPIEVREIILNAINPSYEHKFGWKPSRTVYNISSLTHGPKAFLSFRERDIRASETNAKRGFNRHLVRGSAIDELVKTRLEEWDACENGNVLRWRLSYDWRNGDKDILLIGHYDLFKDNVVLEIKAPESEARFIANGSMLRAKRQVAAYAKILGYRTGRRVQAFVVMINEDIVAIEVSPEEIDSGWQDIRRTAYQVAKVLDA